METQYAALPRHPHPGRAARLPVAELPFRSLGADDFSHFGQRVPIVMMFVGTGEEADTRHDIGLQHAKLLPGEHTIRTCLLYTSEPADDRSSVDPGRQRTL